MLLHMPHWNTHQLDKLPDLPHGMRNLHFSHKLPNLRNLILPLEQFLCSNLQHWSFSQSNLPSLW